MATDLAAEKRRIAEKIVASVAAVDRPERNVELYLDAYAALVGQDKDAELAKLHAYCDDLERDLSQRRKEANHDS